MRAYHEYLRVPVSWWLLGFAFVAMFGTELIVGLGWVAAAAGYTVLATICTGALLLSWRTSVEVSGRELRAGRARLGLERAGEVTALDEARTRLLRGRHGDPGAFVLTRPYLKRAVYIEVTGGGPYWLIGSRHPEQLAAAIEKSRPAARAGDVPVG
jgi:Protein of unknown function (DUF3093)